MVSRMYEVSFNGCEWEILDRFGNRVNKEPYDSSFDAVKDAIAFEQQDQAIEAFDSKESRLWN